MSQTLRPVSVRILLVVMALCASLLPPLSAVAQDSRLTNLDHLNFLGDDVDPPDQAGHTTYRLDEEPEIGVLWTYANPNDDGTYRRVGGGDYDPDTDTWGQGAYNADDMARAAVVYIRHYNLFGDDLSQERAYQLLRGVTYLQTATGENAGGVVLWMQPDGTLSPVVAGDLDGLPSDSEDSYWLARTIWALGEGYAMFADLDADFADFLQSRMELSLDALYREIFDVVGDDTWVVDGLNWPAYMIQDGADASSEAVYGLAAYVDAGGNGQARDTLDQLADGIASMQLGDYDSWPYGALMPWARSRSLYHSWAASMAGALATAGTVVGEDDWIDAAVGEAGRLTPHMLAQGGPTHEWQPGPMVQVQISYSADSQVQALLRTYDATGNPGFEDLAGIAAAWYFGNNPAKEPMYDPATGRTFDGIESDRPRGEAQRINVNSGAESTIHGLLTMLQLDARPDVAAQAMIAERVKNVNWAYVEAEAGTLSGNATVVTPEGGAWTGESVWGGGAYVELRRGGSVSATVTVPEAGDYLVQPIIHRIDKARGRIATRTTFGGYDLGVIDHRKAGDQGITPLPGYQDVVSVGIAGPVRAGEVTVTSSNFYRNGKKDRTAVVDAFWVQPEVEYLVLQGEGSGQALLRSFASGGVETRTIDIPKMADPEARVYDQQGNLVSATALPDGTDATVTIQPGGFTIVGEAQP